MGGFLTICYCFRTTGCCFPYCFLEIFVGGQDFDGGSKVVMRRLLFCYCFLEIFVGRVKALMEGNKVVMEDLYSPHTKENPVGSYFWSQTLYCRIIKRCLRLTIFD